LQYRIEYSPEAEDHLRALTARQRAIVLGAVDRQLIHQPTQVTTNRKPMRPIPLHLGSCERAHCVYTTMSRKSRKRSC
jgi:hypothetical protein